MNEEQYEELTKAMYDAYLRESDEFSTHDTPLPNFDELTDHELDCWFSAAQAAFRHIENWIRTHE